MIDHFPSADQRLPANETTEESPKKILEAAGNEYKKHTVYCLLSIQA